MAPIKFEEGLKEKLEERSLNPSPESWSKLSDRLDAQSETPRKSLYWWMSIAAGLILMIAISVQFFSSKQSNEVSPQIVEEPSVKSKGPEMISEVDEVKMVAEQLPVQEERSNVISKPVSPVNKQEKEVYDVSPSKTQIAENRPVQLKQKTSQKEAFQKAKSSGTLDEGTLETAVAVALEDLKTNTTTPVEREVDSLLKAASKALFKETLEKESTITVNAEALLLSVEEDMGQSFRSQVFEALKDSYETVKTAVVQRNN